MVSKQDGVALLQGVPLFSGLSKKELAAIWQFMRVVSHDDGHQIVVEGKKGQGFHLILDGEVSVRRKNRRIRLAKGDFFGEMALIDDGPRSATVTAVGPVTTASIASWEFKSLAADNAAFLWKLLLVMTARLRDEQAASANLVS
ncbi:MAG TPA: cyclic nucleotide-binding domain-containing protein [Ilumatobacter sp.]